MPEAEAASGARVFLRREWGRQVVSIRIDGGRRLELVLFFLVGVDLGVRTVAVRGLGRSLRDGDQFGEHPGKRVDLVAAKLRPRGEARRMVGQHPFESQHQRVAALPLIGRGVLAGFHLLDRVVEGEPSRGARREYDGRVFVSPEKRFSGPVLGAGGGLVETINRLRR